MIYEEKLKRLDNYIKAEFSMAKGWTNRQYREHEFKVSVSELAHPWNPDYCDYQDGYEDALDAVITCLLQIYDPTWKEIV